MQTSDSKQIKVRKTCNKHWSEKRKDGRRKVEKIKRKLSLEIVRRYHFLKGKIENQLQNDPDVIEAINILNDSENYNKLLGYGTEEK